MRLLFSRSADVSNSLRFGSSQLKALPPLEVRLERPRVDPIPLAIGQAGRNASPERYAQDFASGSVSSHRPGAA